jgi:uridine monophosphate synthetase
MRTHEISETLFEIGAIKIGAFVLKSGMNSPIYIDLRTIISYPHLMNHVTTGFTFKTQDLKFDLICGVPYTAIPLATALSLRLDRPQVLKRKEAKAHGLKKMIEGVFEPGQSCLLIEDIVTSGSSILETIRGIEEAGLKVTDAICIIDREQGAKENLKKHGYQLHPLFTLSQILENLQHTSKIAKEKVIEIKSFIKSHPYMEP